MALCNLPGLIAACVPWRWAARSENREFWVSDEDCLECYDCRSAFTFYNRRHHCRDCGRIFCWKCASNWIPSQYPWSKDLENRDTIRVCNQCFKHSQPRSDRRGSIHGSYQTATVDVEEQSGSILESILNCVLPNRVKFVATSSLYAAGMDSEESSKKKSKNDDDRDKRFVMSKWRLPFAKFLGLSLSNHAAATRCGYLRFYRSREMVGCFHYASMDIHSVYLPPLKLDFRYENHEFMEKERNEVRGWMLNAIRIVVKRNARLAIFRSARKVRDEMQRRIADLENMCQYEKSEFEESLQKILKQGHPSMDILELNRLRRELVLQSYIWAHRLIYGNSLDGDKDDSVSWSGMSFFGRDGARFLLPVGVKDTVIPVYDDEPTSAVAYALVSRDYLNQLSDEPKGHKETKIFPSSDEMMLASRKSLESRDDTARVCFYNYGPLGKRYMVTCYYAKSFEALRKICCPSETDFVRSLSRCKRWGAQGGKSNPFFAKTYDERFIIKQVTKTELESFLKFAPQYFKYLSESIDLEGGTTCLAKILGIYQVRSKPVKGGKKSKMDIMVMENLLYGRTITRLHEIKGSTCKSRYDPDSPGSNKVLLDQILIEAKPTPPIFVGSEGMKMLERAVWNDTCFLNSVDVMDYSLLVGVDEEKHELVIGIIDFMRQYTWHKHLDTWVKAPGILGGPKISPGQYKKRFRKAMTSHILMVPDQCMPPSTTPISDIVGESNTQTPTCAE